LTSVNKFSRDLIGGRSADVRAIRRQLRMSQQEFARVYRIPLATLKNWEQGRRQPDAPAAACLQVIAKRPREVLEALAS
jgi:putative transcriptional regulator